MAIFGIMFVMVGILFLLSPLLPGNKIEDRVDLAIAISIGFYFVLYGVKEVMGIENRPVTDAVAAAFVLVIFILLGYSLYKE